MCKLKGCSRVQLCEYVGGMAELLVEMGGLVEWFDACRYLLW